jgi:uncharacterized membrane protein
MLALFTLMAISQIAKAQPAEMADTMRSNGKIYVVVGVVTLIFVVLFTYLMLLDRRLSALEKNDKTS